MGQVDSRFSYNEIYMLDIFHLKGERRDREREREERERERERESERERERERERC